MLHMVEIFMIKTTMPQYLYMCNFRVGQGEIFEINAILQKPQNFPHTKISTFTVIDFSFDFKLVLFVSD